jgi:hypothetical protein
MSCPLLAVVCVKRGGGKGVGKIRVSWAKERCRWG